MLAAPPQPGVQATPQQATPQQATPQQTTPQQATPHKDTPKNTHLSQLAEAFVQHLTANRYLGSTTAGSSAAINLVQLANIYERAFKPEYQLVHGSTDSMISSGPPASEVLQFMTSDGWISLDSADRVTGLPRHGVICPSPASLVPSDTRRLTEAEEGGLRGVRKLSHSPLHVLHVQCSASGYFPLLSSLASAAVERTASLVLVTGAKLAAGVSSRELAWPGYSHHRRDTAGVIVHHHNSLHVEEVTDPGSEEAGVLWLAVTQGGRGANTREKTSLLACVGEAQPGQLEAYLRPALARVRRNQPGSKLLLASSRPASDSLMSQLGLTLHMSSPGLALVADIAKEEIQVDPLELPGGQSAMLARLGNTYCSVCSVWLETVREFTGHQDSAKHKKNHIFKIYQKEKEKLLRNPHSLGLEIRVAEPDQGVEHNSEQGLVTITSGPGQARSFQLVLTNTREEDIEQEKEEDTPKQIGVVVEQVGIPRSEAIFQLQDEHGITGQEPKKIRLRTMKKYRVNVRACSDQVGHYRVPVIVAFYHDTASPKASSDCRRFIMSHMGLELLLRVQTPEMASLAPSRPFSQPRRIHEWTGTGDLVRVSVPAEMQHDKTGDKLRKLLGLEHYLMPKARRRMLATNFTKAETREEREQVVKCRRLLEQPLCRENYKERWGLLLHSEEQQLETDIHHYDMGAVTLRQLPSKRLFELRVPGLQENRPSVMRGDKICLKQQGARGAKEYEGHVSEIREDKVEMFFHEKFVNSYVKGIKFDVRFTISRFPMRNMHRAVELAADTSAPLLSLLFPTSSQLVPPSAALPNIRCKNRAIEENSEQLRAVQHIVAGSSGTAPYLVFGPPGTGKTVTVVEAIKQVYELFPDSHIVATAPSNAAADLLADRLRQHIGKRHMLRIHAASRSLATVPEALLPISNVDRGRYTYPSLEELLEYRIIVITLVSAGRLVSANIKAGHFTHLFIDEAGQATEPELVIPLRLIGAGGKLVMVGDPKQLGPVIRSSIGSRNGLAVSMLERMMEENSIYSRKEEAGYDPRCITKLVKNFRSHPALLEVPARLYYHSELLPCADTAMVSSCLQFPGLSQEARGKVPLIFRGIIGQDLKEEMSPSFFNAEEAVTVLDYVKEITGMKENRVAAKEIGVITPYRRQVQKIRKKLAEHGLTEVTVGSTEEFQGQERKVIIVSTVRSTPEYVTTDSQYRLGFLANPKRFNVAITRAKALLIIVGNPHILAQDPAWADLLSFAREKGCYTGCPYDQETDEDLDRLEAKMRGLMLRGREEDEITLLTQLEEPAWRTDY